MIKNILMTNNCTLAIIKPDAIKDRFIGQIITLIENHGFNIVQMRMLLLNKQQAEDFYSVHKGKPFLESLVDFMTSGNIIALHLESENAVEKWRTLIGATDPAEAEKGTVRKLFASSKQCNAVHGSDSDQNAKNEINFFFS